MIVFCICCISLFSIEQVCLWLCLSCHFLDAFSDPHVWPLIEKNPVCSVVKSSKNVLVTLLLTESCTSPLCFLLRTLTHRWLIWWFFFWQDVSMSFYYSKVWDLNWKPAVTCFYTTKAASLFSLISADSMSDIVIILMIFISSRS